MKVILQVVDPHLMNTSMSSKRTHVVVVSCRVLQLGMMVVCSLHFLNSESCGITGNLTTGTNCEDVRRIFIDQDNASFRTPCQKEEKKEYATHFFPE